MNLLFKLILLTILSSFITLQIAKSSSSSSQIKMVGSSTVYPFAIIISGLFSKINPNLPTVESNGSGGGFKLFCEGVGESYPDIVNSSRKIKQSEIDNCISNEVSSPIEVKIGYDAITLIHNKKIPNFNLSTKEIFLALAENIPDKNNNLIKNPYKNWSEINPKLPNIPIKVLGPPSSSGTKDSFLELAMEAGCHELNISDKNTCTNIRQDGSWIISGEDDHLIISKVSDSKDLIGILGYNFYDENKSKLSVVSINSISPSKANVISKKYPLSRPLYMYFKTEHLLLKKELMDFLNFLIDDKVLGESGYLTSKGLIPITAKEKEEISFSIKNIKLN